MIIQSTSPSIELNSIVKEYYYLKIDAKDSFRSIPIIDDCCYDLVFFKEGNASFMYDFNEKSIDVNSHIFTIHDLNPPYKIGFHGSLTFFTIKLHPWVNGVFFSWIKDKGVINISKAKNSPSDLFKLLFQNDNFEEMFQFANDFMLKQTFTLSPNQELVKSMCDYIQLRQGIVKINELSNHFDKSRQYLSRVFKREVLYSLKFYITSVRILDLIKYKRNNDELALTEICYDYGYYDQAHFINDFKKVCGVTPSKYFSNLPEFILRH